ncbi:MAG: bis-aminopropyl spermidine synthase family protein [Sandaracinus sp.]|nr:bis-aminopropyl spermidine synthase family protein [Sandaracinus sp.]
MTTSKPGEGTPAARSGGGALTAGALEEGAFRVLRVLASAEGAVARSALLRDAGEPHSVLAKLERDHPTWWTSTGEKLGLSPVARALVEEERRRRTPRLDEEALVEALREAARGRPRVKRELDQVWLTLPSVARRARALVEAGEPGRHLLFLGDDDLASLALHLLGMPCTVLDLDDELVAFLSEAGVEAHVHDLREPLPRAMRGRFGAVFTDPPYAPEGFALFGSRAVEAMRVEDARFWVAFGWSRRASERGLAKQRVLTELGLVAEEVIPDFGVYDGAESLGARSALWVCRRTPQAKPLVLRGDGELYTRRKPNVGKRGNPRRHGKPDAGKRDKPHPGKT